MEAIILAGGFGTRLRSVVSNVPKPMAPVAGHPFLEILIQSLANKGFRRVILSVGYQSDKIISHFGEFFAGVEIEYQVESEPLGTGGAILASLPLCQEDHVHIINGDTFLDVDVSALEAQWESSHMPIIVARKIEDVGRYGSMRLQGNRIMAFSEKGKSGSGLINAGWYVMPTKLLRLMQLPFPFSFESDSLGPNVHALEFHSHVTTGLFIDIGVPEDYARSQTLLKNFVQ
jgi:D-glycero-alpha-D-manno-heptose 1-phosphate guanylyltransferase